MSITVELEPDVEQRLRAQAAEAGVAVHEYVAGLIRRAANGMAGEQPTLAEFEADWGRFADGLDHIAPLPAEAFSREAMYRERE